MPTEIIAALIFAALIVLFLAPNFKHVKEDEALVIERLGAFLKVIDQPGIHFLIPLVDRAIQKESLLPQTHELIFTKDQESYHYVYTFQIVDIKMYCYAATESFRVMEELIKTQIHEGKNQLSDLQETLLNIGVKLQKLNEINK